MSQQLRFNADEAMSAKGKLDQKATEIKGIMGEVKSTMTEVASGWKGDAANKYIAQYDKIAKTVDELIKCVNTIGEQLEAQAKAQREEDTEIASMLENAIK